MQCLNFYDKDLSVRGGGRSLCLDPEQRHWCDSLTMVGAGANLNNSPYYIWKFIELPATQHTTYPDILETGVHVMSAYDRLWFSLTDPLHNASFINLSNMTIWLLDRPPAGSRGVFCWRNSMEAVPTPCRDVVQSLWPESPGFNTESEKSFTMVGVNSMIVLFIQPCSCFDNACRWYVVYVINHYVQSAMTGWVGQRCLTRWQYWYRDFTSRVFLYESKNLDKRATKMEHLQCYWLRWQNTDVILLRFVEMLKDDDVLRKLRLALFHQALADKIDTLTQTTAELNVKLETKESRIAALEEKVDRI